MVLDKGRVLKITVWVTVVLNEFAGYYAAKHMLRVVEPSLGQHTAAPGSDYTAVCQSEEPILWYKRGVGEPPKRDYSYEPSKRFVSTLDLRNISSADVGFYDCVQMEKGKITDKTTSFYLYVDDSANLMVGAAVVRASSERYSTAVVPCRPTAEDVSVELLTSSREPIPFSLNADDVDRDVYFDSRRGFLVPAHLVDEYWYSYVCVFTKRGVRQEKEVDLFIERGGLRKYLEYHKNTTKDVVVKAGDTVTLVAEVHANFEPQINWYNNNGEDVVSNDKHSVELISGEPWVTRLVINAAEASDAGIYKVTTTTFDWLNFRIVVEEPPLLEIEVAKVYDKDARNVSVYCYGDHVTSLSTLEWTFRPQECVPIDEDGCEDIIKIMDGTLYAHMRTGISSVYGTVVEYPKLGNLTCSVTHLDNSTESVTKPIIISEVLDGFEIEISPSPYVNITCIVSKYLYSEHVYWIGLDGFVIGQNMTSDTRNIILRKSEDKYSHKLNLVIENATDEDNGFYRCMAVNNDHVPEYRSELVNATYMHTAFYSASNSSDSDCDGPNKVLLYCAAPSRMGSNITWYKEGVRVYDACIQGFTTKYLVLSAYQVDVDEEWLYGCQFEDGTDLPIQIIGGNYHPHIRMGLCRGWLIMGAIFGIIFLSASTLLTMHMRRVRVAQTQFTYRPLM